MTILHVITGLGNGGAEAVLVRLIESDAHDVHVVVSLTDGGVYADRLRQRGVRVTTLNLPRGRVSPTAFRRLISTIRDVAPDVVQTWMYHADLLGGLAARLSGSAAVVWGVHSANLKPTTTARSTRLVAWVCARLSSVIPDAVVCCSDAAATLHVSRGYARDAVVTVSNGIDLLRFRNDPAARTSLRSAFLDEDKVVFGMVARWHPLKDHLGFIRAVERLARRVPEGWKVWLVGPGIDESNRVLIAAIEQAGVMDRIRCLGPRDDIPSIMAALDVHVLPSVSEAFGNVTIEAMACGAVPIVTAVGEGTSIVGTTGWVVPPADPERLASAMAEAITSFSDREHWLARQRAARDRVVSRFSVEGMVDGYRRVWCRAVSAHLEDTPSDSGSVTR